MKNSIIVFLFFCAGCLLGFSGEIKLDAHHISLYILYALMLQVGINIGSNKNLKQIVRQIRLKMLVIPLATIIGTLLFSALASLLLSRWSVFECMAVGSGFAYYSLSSIAGNRIRNHRFAIQYHPRNDGLAGQSTDRKVFRQTGSDIGCRCQFDGCGFARHYPLFWEGNDSGSHPTWYSD